MCDVLTTEEQLQDKHRQAMDACNWYRKQDFLEWKWVYDLAMAIEDVIHALRNERAENARLREAIEKHRQVAWKGRTIESEIDRELYDALKEEK